MGKVVIVLRSLLSTKRPTRSTVASLTKVDVSLNSSCISGYKNTCTMCLLDIGLLIKTVFLTAEEYNDLIIAVIIASCFRYSNCYSG